MGEIEKVPLIEDLEKFALKLQPEHRSRLYRTAESFFCVGAMQGAFAGLDSSIHTTSPKKNQQEEWIAYLKKRQTECAV